MDAEDAPEATFLLDRAAGGDADAWGTLLARCQDRLLCVAAFRLDPRLRGGIDAAAGIGAAEGDPVGHARRADGTAAMSKPTDDESARRLRNDPAPARADEPVETADGSDEALAALADDFAARVRRGERVTVEGYAAGHPDLAARIRRVFPAIETIEGSILQKWRMRPPSPPLPCRPPEYRRRGKRG